MPNIPLPRPARLITAAARRGPLLISVLTAVIILALVVLSPFALSVFARDNSVDWNSLSTVGQTYGAVSAVIAVLALGGVAVSIAIQNREAKSNREQALRVLHVDLLKMAMENPDYMECWGPFRPDADPVERRQTMYINMIISHWEMMYELGALTEAHLREVSSGMFRGARGRAFWSASGEKRIRTAHGRREVRFQLILDEEYRRAVAAPDPQGGSA